MSQERYFPHNFPEKLSSTDYLDVIAWKRASISWNDKIQLSTKREYDMIKRLK